VAGHECGMRVCRLPAFASLPGDHKFLRLRSQTPIQAFDLRRAAVLGGAHQMSAALSRHDSQVSSGRFQVRASRVMQQQHASRTGAFRYSDWEEMVNRAMGVYKSTRAYR